MKRAVAPFYSTFLLAAVTAARLPKSGGHHRQATYYSVIKRAFVITDRVVGVLATKLLPSKPHQQLHFAECDTFSICDQGSDTMREGWKRHSGI